MTEDPDPDPEPEQRAGELNVGAVAFNPLPYDPTQSEAKQMRKDLAEKLERRGPFGFRA